jgi:hypothetical protein
MAGENLATIFNALPQLFEGELQRQWNRTTVFLDQIRAAKGVSEGKGKNVAFDVEFSGATASTVAEGSDVASTEYAQDIDVPAIAPWAHYRSSFQVTETELDAAFSSGPAGMPTALTDIFGARILSAGAQIAAQIENDALIGTGVDTNGNPTVIGIYGGAISATGVYLNINPATYTEWASNVTSNGGVTRQFTPDLAEQVDTNIFTSASIPWNLAMTSPGVARKWSQFFTQGSAGNNNLPLVRMNDNAGQPVYGLGVPNDSAMQYDKMYLKGRPLMRNRLNPTGKLALLNTDKLIMKYLPASASMQRDLAAFYQLIGLQGSSGGNMNITATGMPMRVARIAKTGDSIKVSMKITCQMAVTRRNAHGLLVDISEA